MRLTPEQYGRLPALARDIVDYDRRLEPVRLAKVVPIRAGHVIRELRGEKRALVDRAVQIWGCRLSSREGPALG